MYLIYIWENRSKIEMGNRFISFIYKLVYNKSLNVIRQIKIIDKAAKEIAEKSLDYYSPYKSKVIEKMISSEQSRVLMEAINSLPKKGRQCINMKYIRQMKIKDIAIALDISPRTVETHLYRSLKTLYEYISRL